MSVKKYEGEGLSLHIPSLKDLVKVNGFDGIDGQDGFHEFHYHLMISIKKSVYSVKSVVSVEFI